MRKDKSLAIKLRRQGKSYNDITKILGVPKSTLSCWLKNVIMPSQIRQKILKRAQKIWAQNITNYNKRRALLIKKKWQIFEDRTSNEIKKISLKELKLIGTALYWAEGYKKARWSVMFCNSDPNIIKLMLKFFREVCLVPKEKLKPQIQIHPYISEVQALKYWSKITGLSINKFRKTLKQVSKSSKLKRDQQSLPYGTFRIHISDVKLVHRIKGWINGVAKQNKI